MAIRSCPECGMNLKDSERVCPVCGAKVNGWKRAIASQKRRNPKAKGAQIKAVVMYLFFAGIAVAKLFLSTTDYEPAEIRQTEVKESGGVSSIEGCPEFYDVKWKMSVDEVVSLTGGKCYTKEDDSENGRNCIYLYPDTPVDYLGFESSLTAAAFAKKEADGSLSLNSVYMVFDAKSVTFEQMHDKITQKYGKSNVENMWVGPYTIITIEKMDSNEFFVNYTYSYNMVVLSEQPYGPDVDPLGLAGESSVLGKDMDTYLLNIPHEDYSLSKENGKKICKLYNGIRYIDIPQPEIYVQLTAGASGKIESVKYVFPLKYDRLGSVSYILDTIEEELGILYGRAVSCSFRSFDGPYRAKSNDIIAVMDEIKECGHGVYEILWNNASAHFSLDAKNEVYTGTVTFNADYTLDK